MYELSIALAPASTAPSSDEDRRCDVGSSEVFVDIQGYEGYYQVSNYGNVRSLDRVIKEKTGKIQTLKGRILKPRINPGGYYHVGLGKNGTRATFAIHQLVARAFIPNPNKKRTVNHINGDKLSNNVSNLEWSTYSENLEHAYKTGLRQAVKPSEVACKNYRRKLNEQQVREIKRLIVADFLTLKQIANQYNVGRSTISSIKSGRNWRHIGSM
jgi:hypothetical protein